MSSNSSPNLSPNMSRTFIRIAARALFSPPYKKEKSSVNSAEFS